MTKKVLIVDDSDSVRNILKLTLKLKGYQTVEAQNGQEAYDLIKQSDFDLIISDIDMPIMNGLELLNKVRKELNNKTVPLVICTAEKLSNEEDIIAQGATKIIHKPFSPNELLDLILKIGI